MKNLSRVFTGVMLMAFLLIFAQIVSANAAPTTKNLEDDTRIAPPGIVASQWWNNLPIFKKGTIVTLNENGEILEGTLAEHIELPCAEGEAFYYYFVGNSDLRVRPSRIIGFKADTKVTFNDKGEVIKGTIDGSFVDIPVSQTNYIGVQDGTEISFHENGVLASCTPTSDIYLRPLGWRKILNKNNTNTTIFPGLVQFRKGTPLKLNDKCEVTEGTLNNNTKLLSPDGTIKVYQAGTTVEFDDNGFVIKASIYLNYV